jgi:hypothetical protein
MRAVLIWWRMTVPGSNLLNMAMGLIGAQAVGWRKYLGKVTNAAGFDVITWAEAVTVYGSFQPVSDAMVQQLGLDMTKNYATFFASENFGEVDRDKTGDRLVYAGKTYQIESKTPWHSQDGWDYVLCVEVKNASE